MHDFTSDEHSALFHNSDHNDGKFFKESPSSAVIQRILGYNRALSVRRTKMMPTVKVVLN